MKTKYLSGIWRCLAALILNFSFLISNSALGQGGTWTWLSGTNTTNSVAVFGTQGIPSVNNHPPGLYEPLEWKDKQGNFWVYGGTYPNNCDLWKYNPITNEWTWVKGNKLTGLLPVYGTKGVPDPANTPGTRNYGAGSWTDTSGALWLFGGYTTANDLWKYDIGTNQWTWMSGSNTINAKGVYGTQGVPSPANTPGTREENGSTWTDNHNNLWLFGGYGYDASGLKSRLNDLWKYDIITNEWTWMKGSSVVNALSDYGILGVASNTNDPGGRWSYTRYKDKAGDLWIFGGSGLVGEYNDMWKFDPAVNQWTWMGGPKTGGSTGKYISKCAVDSTSLPYSRREQRASVTDNCGRFWMFGGLTGGSYLNDLWFYDPQQLKWIWLSGPPTTNQAGNYGTKGAPAITNLPPSRFGGDAWWGKDNKFYIFGGMSNGTSVYCDIWSFAPDTSCVSLCTFAGFQATNTVLCENFCTSFTDLSANATSWSWTFPGGLPSSSTDQNPASICYTAAGVYDVKLIAVNPGGTDSLVLNNYITVDSAPATPIITQADTILYCSSDSSYISYQWYDNNTLIPGATDSMLIINHNGNYNVEVTNTNGCKIAVGINIVLGLQNYMSDRNVFLSPNPVRSLLTLHSTLPVNETATVSIMNALGQVVSIPPVRLRSPSGAEVDVSGLAAGIYFLQLKGEKGNVVKKFVKE